MTLGYLRFKIDSDERVGRASRIAIQRLTALEFYIKFGVFKNELIFSIVLN